MSEQSYSVVFRGDIVIGQRLPKVKARFKKIFKTDDARIDALFSGKPTVLKRKLTEAEAQRYQGILKQAGAVVAVEADVPSKPAAEPVAKMLAANTESTLQGKTNEDSKASTWGLAPTGSDLGQGSRAEQTEKEVRQIPTEYLSIAAQEGNLVKDEERSSSQPSDLDIDVLGWGLTLYGEALLKESEHNNGSQAIAVDTSGLSLAEMEGNLVKESEKVPQSVIEVDTSQLTLAPASNDLNEQQ